MRCIGAHHPPCVRCTKSGKECVVHLPRRGHQRPRASGPLRGKGVGVKIDGGRRLSSSSPLEGPHEALNTAFAAGARPGAELTSPSVFHGSSDVSGISAIALDLPSPPDIHAIFRASLVEQSPTPIEEYQSLQRPQADLSSDVLEDLVLL